MTPFDETPTNSRRRLLIWSGAIAATVLIGAAAVLMWAPWHRPAPPLVTSLPNTCPALLGLPAPESQGGGTGTGEVRDTQCHWGTPIDDAFSPVEATTTLYTTIDAAQRASASQVTIYNGPTHGFSLGADTPIAGVGDDARISAHGDIITLVARKANVVLSLEYITPSGSSAADNQAILATAARTILGDITLTAST
ncbi:MAG TPA: hypothetical protein VGM75_11285 [Pseudonocardiaceae bacterium]